jgi:hypothetical protein
MLGKHSTASAIAQRQSGSEMDHFQYSDYPFDQQSDYWLQMKFTP